MKKWKFLLIILIPLFFIYVHPNLLFKYHYGYKHFAIYYDNKINIIKLRGLLDSIEIHLSSKNILITGTQNLYLVDDKNKLMFLALSEPNFFGQNQDFNKIIINKANIDSNIVKSYSPKYNRRSFVGVVEHELTHTNLNDKLGFLRYKFLIPTWKNEGYCDYISNGGSFPLQKGLELLKNNLSDDSYSFRYFVYFMRVKYLLDVKKIGLEKLLDNTYDEESLDKEVRLWVESHKITFNSFPNN